jgi:hypothetical protein
MTGLPAGASRRRIETPIGVVSRSLVAGAVATGLLSVLGRLAAPVRLAAGAPGRRDPPLSDPFDPVAAPEWPRGAPALPAAGRAAGVAESPEDGGDRGAPPRGRAVLAALSPATVLALSEGPGPEAAAAQFARKVMSGVFGRDISQYTGVAGEVVHFTYGGLWGVVYGLVQSSYGLPPVPSGLLFGLLVWLIGPAWLVPAMRLMAPPAKEPPLRLAVMVAGHLIYGLAVAAAYRALAPRRPGPAGRPAPGAREA